MYVCMNVYVCAYESINPCVSLRNCIGKGNRRLFFCILFSLSLFCALFFFAAMWTHFATYCADSNKGSVTTTPYMHAYIHTYIHCRYRTILIITYITITYIIVMYACRYCRNLCLFVCMYVCMYVAGAVQLIPGGVLHGALASVLFHYHDH